VQNNVSFNNRVGVTRGVHAEPWDKLVSLASGRIFGAWVDLRRGDGFGRCFTAEMGRKPRSLCRVVSAMPFRRWPSTLRIPIWSMITGPRSKRVLHLRQRCR
jgi:hypothetical protein